MNGTIRTLSRQLFDYDYEETPGQRWHFRLVEVFLVVFTLQFCWEWGAYIQQNISEVMLPLGLAQYIDVSFMFDHHVALGNAAVISVLLALGLFRVWSPAYAIALLLFHMQYVARYSLGEISHGSNLVGMGILLLGLAHLFFRSESARRRFTFGSLYFFIGLGYTSAAVCKLIGTGIMWPHGHHLLMWIMERKVDTISKFGAFDPNLLQELVLQNYHWGTAILLFGLVAEGASFMMWFRKYRYYIVMLVVSMHIGIAVTMNIFFEASTYFLILLGLPWGRIFDWVRTRLRISSSPRSSAPAAQ
jgi:hypothetical protein